MVEELCCKFAPVEATFSEFSECCCKYDGAICRDSRIYRGFAAVALSP
jgi:hypothetical protein